MLSTTRSYKQKVQAVPRVLLRVAPDSDRHPICVFGPTMLLCTLDGCLWYTRRSRAPLRGRRATHDARDGSFSTSSSGEALSFIALTGRRPDRTSSWGRCTASSPARGRCDGASGACADSRSACTCSGRGGMRIFAGRRTRSARVLPSCASASISSRRWNTGDPGLSCRRGRTWRPHFAPWPSSRGRCALFGRSPRSFLRIGSSRENLKKTNVHALISGRPTRRESHTDLALVHAWELV